MKRTTRWKFGEDQSVAEERAEIAAARKVGLGAQYVEGQRWNRMREVERRRKQARKAMRRRTR